MGLKESGCRDMNLLEIDSDFELVVSVKNGFHNSEIYF
jgi:hypothetical protein